MSCRPLRPSIGRLFVALLGIGLPPLLFPMLPARGQLQTLSAGNADQQWRDAQLQAFDQQLADPKLPDALKRELVAQRSWLSAWEPKSAKSAAADDSNEGDSGKGASDKEAAGGADSPPAEAAADAAANNQAEENQDAELKKAEPIKEPVVDPDDRAKELRTRLFDPERPATAADTKALQTALSEHSGDLGLRQLQLHWIDQATYRDAHWQEIAEAADRVLALLGELPATEETKAAAAYANYRKARVLAHVLRGRPLRGRKIAGSDKLSDDKREEMQNAIGECWRQIEALVGSGHAEFFQLEVYNLRRYGWSGQALKLLERHASALDELAYLAERRTILDALGWAAPAEQTAAALAKAKKNAGDEEPKRALEIQYVPQRPANTK